MNLNIKACKPLMGKDIQLLDLLNTLSRSKNNQESKGYSSIIDLPESILVNIFSRLPVNSIFHLKCCCKLWYKLISDPYFPESYLANSPFVSILISFLDVLSYSVEIKAEYNYAYAFLSPCKPKYSGNILNFIKGIDMDLLVIGSCNGVLCLLHGDCRNAPDHSLYITNPILSEWVPIPQPGEKKVHIVAYGFGYAPATGQFKVLRIAEMDCIGQLQKSEAEIFTVGVDKSWREVGPAPYPSGSKICGVSFNGALHWIEGKYPFENVGLFSFDLVEEKVHALPSPHGLIGNLFIEVVVLGNCLCISDNKPDHHLDIWWMRDYGVGESWTRDRILRSWVGPDCNTHLLHPITIWRDLEILMVSRQGYMFSYDRKQKKSTRVKVSGMRNDLCEAIVYVPSFFSLKAVIGEDLLMIDMKSRS